MGGFPHGTGARQDGRISTQHRRPVRWADFHTAPAPGKVGGFPHGTGARQDGRISTQHRRPVRWADFHTAPAPGKVGGFPHGTGARQGGRIPTRHRRAARWADFHTAPAPGKVGRFPYRHVCSLCYLWIVQLSGSLVVWRSVPRNRPRAAANAQYGAASRRRAAVPARSTAHPRGGRTAAAWR
ncbi:hypothetical protein DLA26_23290 [Salmonella enterica]|nr:hypothetical protein [Salmonella enterica]EFN7961421.1 hypothetical protein [Escherichia coli]